MKKIYEPLFDPFRIGACEIPNRIVIPAMTGTNIIENKTGPVFMGHTADYYAQRAKSGVGLIIPGMMPVYSKMNQKWLHEDGKEVFQKAKPIVDEIHRNGSKIFFQIGAGFCGRNYYIRQSDIETAEDPVKRKETAAVLDLDNQMSAADAGLPLSWAPKLKTLALTEERIEKFVEGYAACATLAQEAGADGVEIHAVHEGYLMDQFTTEYTNHRTDRYGGSFENRFRFATDVVKAIKKTCGKDFPVMVRYSVTSKVIDLKVGAVPGETYREIGRDMEESIRAARYLQEAGYDALDADNGTYDSWYWSHPPVYMPLNCNLEDVSYLKKFVDIPVICAGRMQADTAAEAVSEGKIDAVAIGRQFLCDGDFLTKLKEEREEEIRPCISCHNGCLPVSYYNNSGAVMRREDAAYLSHCALNPYTFQEKKYTIRKTDAPKKIAIVGGGIGGMECARLLSKMGHAVTIYEKGDRLGGIFAAAAAPDFKEKDKELLRWYEHAIRALPITVKLNTEIRDLQEAEADEIILATGSAPKPLAIPGSENGISAVDYLLGNKTTGETVAVIGGGLTGCEIAYDLAKKGKKPFLIERKDELIKALGVCAANSQCLKDLLRYYKVPLYLESSAEEIKKDSIIIRTPEGMQEIPCDSVILSTGYEPETALYQEEDHIHLIGDAAGVGNLKSVIWGAYDLAFSL